MIIYVGIDPGIEVTGVCGIGSDGTVHDYDSIKTKPHSQTHKLKGVKLKQAEPRSHTFKRWKHISINLKKFYRRIRVEHGDDTCFVTTIYAPLFISGPKVNKSWLTYCAHGIAFGVADSFGLAQWRDDDDVDRALFLPKFPNKGDVTLYAREKGFLNCPNHHVADAWNAARYTASLSEGRLV